MKKFIKEMITIRYTNGWDLIKMVCLFFSLAVLLFFILGILIWISPILLFITPFVLWVIATAIEMGNNEDSIS